MAAAEEAAAAVGALLAARAGAMSREHHQPTEPPHPRYGAHWDRAARAASATQPPPGTHSLARRPGAEGGRGQRRERERRKRRRMLVPAAGEGSPKLRGSVSQVNPEIKLFQFKHLLSSPPSPRRLRLSGKCVSEIRTRKAKRMASVRSGTVSFPATGGCGSGEGLGASRVPAECV